MTILLYYLEQSKNIEYQIILWKNKKENEQKKIDSRI